MSELWCTTDHFFGACSDVRCDECPNRLELYPKKPTPYDAGWTVEDLVEAVDRNRNVYHPNHYARWKMEPIEFIAINDLPWWLANVIKYTMRFDAKDGLQDLYKARSYLDMKIRKLEGHKDFWQKPVAVERAFANASGTAQAQEAGWAEGLKITEADDTVYDRPRVEGAPWNASETAGQ
jgi:hypothetical protein